MVVQIFNTDSSKLYLNGIDLLANRAVTTPQRSNMYEILFDCKYFDKILNIALKEVKKYTGNDFDVYIKNMWGYMQNVEQNEPINFSKNLRDQLYVSSEYSFVHLVKSSKTTFYFKHQEEGVNLAQGDILVFKTDYFIKEEFDTDDRIALVGAITPITDAVKLPKRTIL